MEPNRPTTGQSGTGQVHAPPVVPGHSPAGAGLPSKIQHIKPGLSRPSIGIEDALKPVTRLATDSDSVPMVEGDGIPTTGGKITAFGRDRRHEDTWCRTPNTTGNGAIHVKTFHCKLTEDAISYMDQSINEWLDAHPQYEVKFVSSTIGTLTGKLKEPALFCQVWV